MLNRRFSAKRSFMRVLPFTLLCFGSFANAADPATYEKDIAPFLKKHCFACHGPDKQEARVRYDRLDGFHLRDTNLWTLVYERLSAGEMPPEDRPQPSADEKRRILDWIERESAAAKAEGASSIRRLNRREISAALQDLTGLPIDYAGALPGDGKVAGFDTGADGLQDAADSVSLMLAITRRAVDGIRFLESDPAVVFAAELKGVKDARKVFDPWKDKGASAKARKQVPELGMLIEPKWLGERGGFEVYVPPPANRRGVVRLTVEISVMKPFKGIPDPHFLVNIGGKRFGYLEVSADHDQPDRLEFVAQLEDLAIDSKGLKISLNNKIEIPYGVKGFDNEDKTKPDEKIPGGPGLFRPKYDRKAKPEEQPVPHIVLQSINIEVDSVATWPPADWGMDLGELADDPQLAHQLIGLWMDRAWRRPVSPAEQERFASLYDQLRKQGLSFDEALRASFQSVLMSGGFRYLASTSDPDPVVSQFAIASRLSFMFWGAPPDAELRELAAEGRLRDPKVLDAQVDRLLADSRSEAFFKPFVEQWLEMGQPITVTMDYFSKQDFRFGRFLKESMREETYQYIAELFRENRPAREIVQSDWTMMNNSLAIHYGYDDVDGKPLRKVKLRKDDPRGGGILGHAGIQSMLCWMGENWVIYRGAWALRHILDDPPPLPPLEVPELNPSDSENHGKTFRELLKQHQADERCSVCHKKMDPLGFAFQNFDLSGRWRDVEHEKYIRNELDGKIEWRGAGKTRPVDATGHLPRGEEFSNYAECKDQIVKHYLPDLVRGVMKNLMLYGTGSIPDVAGMAEIRTVMREQEPQGYPLKALVKGIVRSPSFLGE